MLQVAPSSYYGVKNRRPSARSQRDAVMGPIVRQLWEDNFGVYGARKVLKAARRAGHDVGRDQVARLMRTAGIEGVRRTKRVRTTKPEAGSRFTAIRCGERLAEIGAVPSIGTVGDSYDNALAGR